MNLRVFPLLALLVFRSLFSFAQTEGESACAYDLTRLGVEAVLTAGTMAAVTEGLKYAVHSERPDGSGFDSFPSGHTAAAFAGAEYVRLEFGNGWGAGAYAVAALVGAERIYHNQHRGRDVVAGAAVGILSAHAGRWMAGPVLKALGLDPDRASLTVAPVPGPYPATFSLGAGFSYTF